MNFATWLAGRRQVAGITQRELANKCGVTPAYVAHLENGTSEPPPLKTCRALARGLGTEWEEMWQRSFAARLRKWLKRQGYSGAPEAELIEIARRIELASRRHPR